MKAFSFFRLITGLHPPPLSWGQQIHCCKTPGLCGWVTGDELLLSSPDLQFLLKELHSGLVIEVIEKLGLWLEVGSL